MGFGFRVIIIVLIIIIIIIIRFGYYAKPKEHTVFHFLLNLLLYKLICCSFFCIVESDLFQPSVCLKNTMRIGPQQGERRVRERERKRERDGGQRRE